MDPNIAVLFGFAIIVASCASVAIVRIVRKTDDYELKIYKKKLKTADEYINDLEADIKSYVNALNRKEVGPKMEGDISDLKSILPELLPEFARFGPKWLAPILQVPEVGSAIATYVEKNPQRAGELFARFFKQKGDQKGDGIPYPKADGSIGRIDKSQAL